MSRDRVSTGECGDPAQMFVLPFIADACRRSDEIRRAKDQLDLLPRLTEPPSYVAARATAEGLRKDCLLSVADENAFKDAVAAAIVEYEALP